MAERDERETKLVTNDPAHTASREESERVREGGAPAPRVGGTSPETAASIGSAAGAAAVGAAGGTFIFGPIGTIIGALAGALGGWWAGREVSEAGERAALRDESFRAHYESRPDRVADRAYDHARPGYLLGDLARRNPEYAGLRYDAVEPRLRRAWSEDMQRRYGDWAGMSGYVRTAFEGVEIPDHEHDVKALQDPLPRDASE